MRLMAAIALISISGTNGLRDNQKLVACVFVLAIRPEGAFRYVPVKMNFATEMAIVEPTTVVLVQPAGTFVDLR